MHAAALVFMSTGRAHAYSQMVRSCIVARFLVSTATMAVLAGCAHNWPSQRPYAVLHVVTSDCEPDYGRLPVLVAVSHTDEGSKTYALEYIESCGESARGQRAQVWRSPVRVERLAELRLSAGTARDAEGVHLVPLNTRLRIDHEHIWLGVLHLGNSSETFLVPAASPLAVRLADRQGCERRTRLQTNENGEEVQGCGLEWSEADLLTFTAD